jgi:hypothetical protein
MEHLLCPNCYQEQALNTIKCAQCSAELLLQGRYRLRKRLGGGSSSEIFLADDQSEHQSRCLKIMNLAGQDQKSIERLTQRFALLQRLEHHGISKVFAHVEQSFQERPTLYTVSQWVEGERLTDRLKRGPGLTPSEVESLSKKLLEIIDYLVGCTPPVALRAIKPQNVMLQSNGSPVLINLDTMMQDEPTKKPPQRKSNERLVAEALQSLLTPTQKLSKAKHKPSNIPPKPQRQQRRAQPIEQEERSHGNFDRADPLGLIKKSKQEKTTSIKPPSFFYVEAPREELQRPKRQSTAVKQTPFLLLGIFLVAASGYFLFRSPPVEPRLEVEMKSEALPSNAEIPIRKPLPEATGETIATVTHQDIRIRDRDVEIEKIVWASEVLDVSSERGVLSQASEVLGIPDISEQAANKVWSPKERKGGFEWISVRFPQEVETKQIILLELVSMRGLLRVDDLSGGVAQILWERATSMPQGELSAPSLSKITMQEPRRISAIRVVFDTKEMESWLLVEAIGLVPTKK